MIGAQSTALMTRRQFLSTTLVCAAATDLVSTRLLRAASQVATSGNRLPRWRGFNLTDFNSPRPGPGQGDTTDDDLKWIVDWGFDFVRLPMAYPRYVQFDRSRHIEPS